MTSVLLLVLPLPFDHATVASLQPLMTLHTIPWPMSTTSTRPKLSQTAARLPDAHIKRVGSKMAASMQSFHGHHKHHYRSHRHHHQQSPAGSHATLMQTRGESMNDVISFRSAGGVRQALQHTA